MKKRKDLTGMTFNKLTVIGPANDYVSPTGKRTPQWECECSCAAHNRVIVKSTALTCQKYATKSCGCERRKPDNGRFVADDTNLISEWDYEQNIDSPHDVALRSNIRYYWICKLCGYHYLATPSSKFAGTGCPVCANKICISGINDILTQYQRETDVDRKNRLRYLIEHFQNKEDDAALYTISMSKKVMFRCLECGFLQEKHIYNVFKYGFYCKACSDGVSYPNKFIYALIKQLPVSNIQREWSAPDWLKIGKRKCQYDLYFIYKDNEYVVEMDGGVGHGHFEYGTKEKDTTGLNRDVEKDKRAKEHNITVIRIDCNYPDLLSRTTYIQCNILRSYLAVLFDLSLINWSDCDLYAQNNLIFDVCAYKKRNPDTTVQDISNIFNISSTTTYKYLRKGAELGWCEALPHSVRRQIIQMDLDGNAIARFCNSVEADKAIWGDNHIRGSGVLRACKTHKPYKGFLFIFEDDEINFEQYDIFNTTK